MINSDIEDSQHVAATEKMWEAGRRISGWSISTCSQSSSDSCEVDYWILGFPFETFEQASKLPGTFCMVHYKFNQFGKVM